VIAIGPVQGTAKDGKGAGGKGGGTKSSQLLDGLDWAIAQNEENGDYKEKLDVKKVAAMGHSLGGLQALEVSTDPRITTTVCWNSGVPTSASNAILPILSGHIDLRRQADVRCALRSAPPLRTWHFRQSAEVTSTDEANRTATRKTEERSH
jgi:dienelactone hydrolase